VGTWLFYSLGIVLNKEIIATPIIPRKKPKQNPPNGLLFLLSAIKAAIIPHIIAAIPIKVNIIFPPLFK
jgi:hypothetical protein